MGTKVGINGFGRIGRGVYRAALGHSDLEVVAVNDITDAKTLAHLLKYDSVFGIFPGDVKAQDGNVVVNGKHLIVIAEKEPAKLPWKDLGVELVVESTGQFTDKENAMAHISAGAKRVVISAPAKNEDLTVVLGVNENMYDPAKHQVISNASCTTNCLAPVAKVLLEKFGILSGFMTTIHSYTARAAASSMIPTTTGAAKDIGLVLPELNGKLDGLSICVRTSNVSLVDLVVRTVKPTSKEEVNAAYKAAAQNSPYLKYSEEPRVSKDYNGDPASAIVDGLSTFVIGGDMVKVLAWYDNEWGYSNRVVDLIRFLAGKH